MKVVLLSLSPWEGILSTLANEYKHLELWKFVVLFLWGLPILCFGAVGFHSFLQCLENPSVFFTSRSLAGDWRLSLQYSLLLQAVMSSNGSLLQAGKCGRVNWKWISCLICWHLFQHLSLHLSPSHCWCVYEGGVDAVEGRGAEQGRSFYQPLLFLFFSPVQWREQCLEQSGWLQTLCLKMLEKTA